MESSWLLDIRTGLSDCGIMTPERQSIQPPVTGLESVLWPTASMVLCWHLGAKIQMLLSGTSFLSRHCTGSEDTLARSQHWSGPRSPWSRLSCPQVVCHPSAISAIPFHSRESQISSDQPSITPFWTAICSCKVCIWHTVQVFLEDDSVLLSCSKDGYIRAWSLQTQHCFQTLGGQNGEACLR